MRSKLNEKMKKQLYTSLLVFFVFTLVCLFTNFLSFYKHFLIGSFGLVIYPIVILSICVCIIKLMNRSFSLDKNSLLYCLFIFISFLCILQMALTRTFDFSSFPSYMTDVYNSEYTAGGVIIGLIVFPFRYILHEVATYIIFSIVLVILVACAIDNYYFKMSKIIRSRNVSNRYSNQNSITKITENIINDEKNDKDESIEIKNEIDDEKLENIRRTENAKQVLGLTNKSNAIYKASAYDVLYGDESTRKKAISTLYPEKANVFDINTGSESYLQNNLEKYMPDSYKKSQYSAQSVDEDKKTYDNKKLQSEKNTSIEYINRTLPKTLQKGKIISGDYYTEREEPIEFVEDEYDFNNANLNDSEQNFYGYVDPNPLYNLPEEDNNEEEGLEIIKDAHVFEPKDVLEDVQIVEDKDIYKEQNIDIDTKPIVNDEHKIEKENTTSVAHEEKKESKPVKRHKKYVKPPVEFLTVESTDMSDIQADTVAKSEILETTLSNFKIPAKVNKVIVGPSVTMYEMIMPPGISVKRISSYSDDMAMSLASKGDIRIQAPIPGKNAVGIEVPNEKSAIVGFREVFENGEFAKNASKPLSFVLGKDLYGNYQFCNLAKAPHILVAGSTGSGKSVCLNILILSLIYKCSPQEVKLVLIDPKRVEFAIYEGLPHLMLPSIITEPEKAVNAFSWAVNEMEKRYRTLQQLKIRDIGEYNNLEEVKNGAREKMPYIVIIVDELADLMAVAKRDIEDKIQRLTAKARSAGIHLVIATQRPSIDVVTGTIKNNLPVRIAFSLASFSDSKTVIDQSGAEKLLGKGDMLYLAQDTPEPMRFQSSLVTTEEIKNIVEFVKANNESSYEDNIESIMLESQANQMEQASKPVVNIKNVAENDELFVYALKIVVETRQASASLLQRKLRLGWNRAGSLIDAMQKMNYITPPDNNKRQVLLTMEQFKEIYGEVEDL